MHHHRNPPGFCYAPQRISRSQANAQARTLRRAYRRTHRANPGSDVIGLTVAGLILATLILATLAEHVIPLLR